MKNNVEWRRVAIAVIAVVAALAIAVMLVACTPAPEPAGGRLSTAPPVDGSFADLVDHVSPHVVTVRTGAGLGSGVVFRQDVVLTNEHVVGEQNRVTVEYADGTRSPATVLATDAVTDLAVLRTDRTGLPVAEFRLELPRPGDVVLSMGSPLGFENSVTAGIVSGLHRQIPGSAARSRSLVDLIQTDAPISPGSSGGALFDTEGRVVGINEAYIPPAAGAVSLGFAIPSATAVDVAEQLLEDGKATHPYLGVTVSRLTEEIRERFGVEADHGVVVVGVDENAPAAEAGVRESDVIVALEGTEVRTVEELLGALRSTEPGRRITLTVVRDGDRQELRTTVGSRTP